MAAQALAAMQALVQGVNGRARALLAITMDRKVSIS
jgi:hypothetical protein